jgi:hypothetical protein
LISLFSIVCLSVTLKTSVANAYTTHGEWPSSTIHYSFVNLTQTDAVDGVLAVTNVKDAPANFNLISGTGDIYYYSVVHVGGEWEDVFALTDPDYSSPGILSEAYVYINDAYTDGLPRQGRQHVIAHETGHALGLGEMYTGAELMRVPYSTAYGTYKIFVPLYDDNSGLQYLYGLLGRTQKPNIYKTTNGYVTQGAGGYPERLYISPAGTSQYASAFETRTSLPYSNSIYMTGTVKGSTLYRYAMGLFVSMGPSDRMMTIEMRTNGFYLVKNGASSTISTSIQSNTYYDLYLVVENGLPARAYVLRSGNWVGTAQLSLSYSWSKTVRIGNGVWTDTPSNPASDYTDDAWWNRMLN